MAGILLWGFCLAAPAAVSAGAQNPYVEIQEEGTGQTEGNVPYESQESTNAQGNKVIADPLWEYQEITRTYRLVKTRTSEGQTTYYDQQDGVLQLGTVPGYYYLFDAKGDMVTGPRTVDGVGYYFTPQSRAVADKADVTPDSTTLGRAVRNSWVKIDSSWRWFNSLGRQDLSKTGLQKINGSYYYLRKSSVPYTCKWIRRNSGAWWYFGKNGKYNSNMTGSRKIGGSWYYLNRKGIPCKKCFKTVKQKKYYYGASGKRALYTGWKSIRKRKYYFSKRHYVIKKTGWQKIEGKTYYFGKKGKMYSDRWAKIDGRQYYFKKNGKMATSWTKIKGTYYCFSASGLLNRSTIAKQNGNYYFVTPQGTRGSNILNAVGVNASMSNYTKLRTCFNYVVNNCRYAGGPVWPARGWEPYHAYKMLTTRGGNCYDFAAAFCYLAKAVGYEGMICITGQCASASGGYTPHSWCEYGGLVYDPEITRENGIYLFGVSYGNLPFGYIR